MAMKRKPSRLKPDVDGTNPFSYPRLVQPVLDRNCVGCHEENKDEAPRLDSELVKDPGGGWMNKPTTYFASYLSLTPKYSTWRYTDVNIDGGDLRIASASKDVTSTPGKIGARVSKLYKMLKDGHHDVKLSEEDMRRIIVWLDSYSPFYGVYEPEGGLAQLRGGIAYPTLKQ